MTLRSSLTGDEPGPARLRVSLLPCVQRQRYGFQISSHYGKTLAPDIGVLFQPCKEIP